MRVAAVLGAVLLLSAGAGCSRGGSGAPQKDKGGAKGAMAFPVGVAPVASRAVEYVVTAVGSVDAFEQVQITARVAGAVEAVHFVEGDLVKTGKVLVEIEPQRFDLSARSARATMERATAAKDDAQRGLSRREKLLSEALVSAEELDAWRTKLAVAAAELSQAQAALALAQLNVRDSKVRAPADGVIQTRTVTTGQYVQAGTVLATLLQRDPLLVRFQVPEQDATSLKVDMRARFTVRGQAGTLEAKLTHVADAADPATRMVQVVAHVADPPAGLRPGAFAEITVPVGSTQDAAVIPETAVRPSERGFLAFVVRDDKAEERVLKLGLRTSDGLVEVRSGVRPGEMLVVHGAEALRDGAAVKVQAEAAPGGGAKPLGTSSAAAPPPPAPPLPAAVPAAPGAPAR